VSARVHALGWHVQINMGPDQIVAAEALWNRGLSHPVFTVIRKLVDKGRTWVKLSVTYDNTKDGPPGYADITKVAQAYVKAAPERMGSKWSHPNETNKPDDAMLFDLMLR
jgi:predicted TIM-barrel fold metal-dependent hydrolase